jgi:non-canonical purine NTP pyrophosphatase (RdgB/HAM1 family)
MMKRIIFITENANKFKELQNYLQNYYVISSNTCNVSLEMIKPDAEINEIQSLNKEEIVIHKLYDAFTMCQHLFTFKPEQDSEIWILVEDTSLCISKLGGFPGPFVKFFLQSMPLENIGNDNWGSEARSFVNLAVGRVTNNENGQIGFSIAKSFNGVINGYIVNTRGTNGFGFDPIFRPVNSDKTNAEMSLEEKASYNPRILAFQKVLDYLQC